MHRDYPINMHYSVIKFLTLVFYQACQLNDEDDLERLVDTSIGEDVDMHEVCRYLRIGLLCTQSLPKRRPSMSNVMKMLNDEMDVTEIDLADPGLLNELMCSKQKDSPLSNATMTFSINGR